MKKKIISILAIIIIIFVLVAPNIYAFDNAFDIPQSSTPSEDSFNELMDGQATVTSDDSDSSVTSESVDIEASESQDETTADTLTSLGAFLPRTINLLLYAVTAGKVPNLLDGVQQTEYFTIGNLLTNKYNLFNIDLFQKTTGDNSSLANTLRDNTSIWYVSIRNLAAAGCAVTLIYVGIRMAIASNANDSAKYKKMLVGWLVGFILLFIMQYIMAFLIMLSNAVVQFVVAAVGTDSNIQDVEVSMLTGLIKQTNEYDGWGQLAFLVITCVLVYYELKFFIVYLFRVLKIFFLTVISPLICLSYPIDYVGDGKAQAFNNWFRSLTVLIFMQPMHLIIYVVFMLSAGEIVKAAPLLGVIFLVALDNAEKIIKSALKISGGAADKSLSDIKLPGKGKK